MRLLKVFTFIFMLVFLLSSCAKGEGALELKISAPDKTLVELVSKTYEDSELLKIIQMNHSMKEMNSQFPIECLREMDGIYRVSYLGDGSIAVITFDKDGNRILGNIYHTKLLKSDFNSLAIGQSLEDVKQIDPKGEYLFPYTGRNDTPHISTHYTKDGYLITVEYDAANNILNIKEDLI
ncbi:MAG: hypothetical protein HFE78_05125 [Clostridiales bacterium]|nr:hypothetical protein [Clostridiales bacterium]